MKNGGDVIKVNQADYKAFSFSFGSLAILFNYGSLPKDLSDKNHLLVYTSSEVLGDNFLMGNQNNLVCSAGEFEINSVFLYGSKNLGVNSYNYVMVHDDISIGFVSDCSDPKSLNDTLFTNIDILFIGAGGGGNFTPRDADYIADKLSPYQVFYFGFSEQSRDPLLGSKLLSYSDLESTIESVKPIDGGSITINTSGLKESDSNSEELSLEKFFLRFYATR